MARLPLPAGRRVLLDLYGTDHGPRRWEEPDAFRPERFATRDESPWDFVAQGGGDHATQHRCPGEWITIELMKGALVFLTQRLAFTVPDQDLSPQTHAIPPLPRSRVVLRQVRLR